MLSVEQQKIILLTESHAHTSTKERSHQKYPMASNVDVHRINTYQSSCIYY